MALSKIDVANMVTGATPVANGGTGLTSGTSGQFLKFTGSTTLASAADTGKVVQVQHYAKTSTNRVTGDNTVHSGIVITPTSASNKILCIVTATIESTGTTSQYANISWRRASSDIGEVYNAMGYQVDSGVRQTIGFHMLDTPNTTSEITYSLYHDDIGGNANYDYYETNYTLMEIAT